MRLSYFRSLITVLCVAAMMHANLAAAQSPVAPLSSNDLVLSETSRTAKTTWLGKFESWDKYEPRSFKIAREGESGLVLKGAVQDNANNRLDTTSFTHMGYLQETLPEIVSAHTTRPAGPLLPGMKWTSQITYISAPASWCASDLKMAIDTAYEAEPEESYALRIDGKDVTLPVIPIVSRGTWKRCYNGKLYQRFLWSPELQALLGLEFQTYNPLGKLHEASFSMRVKEVKMGSFKQGFEK
jgi:hypothetical protein